MLSHRSLDSGQISANSTVLDDRDELLHQASRLHHGPAESKESRLLSHVRLSCCDGARCRIRALKSRSRPHRGDAPCITPMNWPDEVRVIKAEMDGAFLKGPSNSPAGLD